MIDMETIFQIAALVVGGLAAVFSAMAARVRFPAPTGRLDYGNITDPVGPSEDELKTAAALQRQSKLGIVASVMGFAAAFFQAAALAVHLRWI